jgi:hypothetical protein
MKETIAEDKTRVVQIKIKSEKYTYKSGAEAENCIKLKVTEMLLICDPNGPIQI